MAASSQHSLSKSAHSCNDRPQLAHADCHDCVPYDGRPSHVGMLYLFDSHNELVSVTRYPTWPNDVGMLRMPCLPLGGSTAFPDLQHGIQFGPSEKMAMHFYTPLSILEGPVAVEPTTSQSPLELDLAQNSFTRGVKAVGSHRELVSIDTSVLPNFPLQEMSPETAFSNSSSSTETLVDSLPILYSRDQAWGHNI